MRTFVRNAESFLAFLHDVVQSQLRCAEDVADFYQEMKNAANIDEFRATQHSLMAEIFSTFVSCFFFFL